MTHTGTPKRVIFGPDSMEITDISTGNIIAKGVANHASKAYEFSHFMPFSEPMHSQREGKIISSTSFVASTSIAEPAISVYEIEIQDDLYPDPVPTPKQEARKMTGNPFDTQKTKKLALCHAISPPPERCKKLLVRCYMTRSDQLHCSQNNRVDHTPLRPKRGKGYIPPSFHHHFGRRWRILHARPQDTCAQNIMHAAFLHDRDEGFSNIFSNF